MASDSNGHVDIAVLEAEMRQIIRAKVPAAAVDDLVQETLANVLAAQGRGPIDDLGSYAHQAARNAVASYHRSSDRSQRLRPRLYDPGTPTDPDEGLHQEEEAAALEASLDDVSPADEAVLRAHHVDGVNIAALAEAEGRSEMAIRLRLARLRARLRVDYTLNYEKVELPGPTCRPVLISLSSGDRRAQRRLAAADHLEDCTVCRRLLAPATGSTRPAIGLLGLLGWRWRQLSTADRVGTAAGGVAASVAAVAVVLALASGGEAEQAAPAVVTSSTSASTTTSPRLLGTLSAAGRPLGSSRAALGAAVDQQVTATDAVVSAVPADEGFWVAADDGGRVWVQLSGEQAESPVTIEPGMRISFTGRLVSQDGRFAELAGVGDQRDLDILRTQGHHIEVRYEDVRPS
ncbi:MAG: rsbT [Ilumatobacteraceae bacterium]|nr:rsbT [Ilumatobacteraceae bacterium]